LTFAIAVDQDLSLILMPCFSAASFTFARNSSYVSDSLVVPRYL